MIQFSKNPIVEAIQAAQCTTVGQVVTDAPLAEFLWDFREELSLGPFSPDDHRGSGATGPDNEGIIREVGDNVPVFPGARVVENIVTIPWTIGNANLVSIGDNEWLCDNFNSEAGDRFDFRDFNGSVAVGDTLTGAVDLKAVTPEDVGKIVKIEMRETGNGFLRSVSVALTDEYVRYSPPEKPVVIDPASLGSRLVLDNDNGAGSPAQIAARFPQVEKNTDSPGEGSPLGAQQWYDTTNANTVDPGTGIVTENPGVPIEGIRGLQLEGERTNVVIPSRPTAAWTTNNATVTLNDVAGPLGDMSAARVEIGADKSWRIQTPSINSSGVGPHSCYLWVKKNLSTHAGVAMSGWGGTYYARFNFDTLGFDDLDPAGTEAMWSASKLATGWIKVMLGGYPSQAGSPDNARVSGTGSGTVDCYVGLGGLEENVAFTSSTIPTDDSAVTRAATKAIAPFASIPELDDDGLVNDFSWQAVLELQRPLDATGGAQVLAELYGSASYYIVVETSSAVPGRITLTMNKGGTTATINFDGVTAGLGDTVDLRGRASSDDGIDFWLDKVKGSTIANTNDFLSPIDTIALNGHTVGGDECFTIGQIVRVAPEALSDAEIEAWEPQPDTLTDDNGNTLTDDSGNNLVVE